MKTKKNILYLVDNYIYLYNKKRDNLYTYKLDKNILKNGIIADIKKFIKSYNTFLSEQNLNNNLFGDSICVIHNPEYTKADIDVLKNILENLSYSNITFINEIKLYKLNTKNAYINYNDEYLILTYIDSYKQKKVLLFCNLLSINEITSLINKRVKKKDILVFGRSKNIDMLINRIKNNKCYHFNNDETYLLDMLKK